MGEFESLWRGFEGNRVLRCGYVTETCIKFDYLIILYIFRLREPDFEPSGTVVTVESN
jgi:hypothetical protein